MAHINAKNWGGVGPRPCDWCGEPLTTERWIHDSNGADGSELESCFGKESRFYIQLGFDGESDVQLPVGYEILIPGSKK